MKDEEIVIRYRLPSTPVEVTEDERKMMEEAQKNFGGQVIKLVMKHLEDNGVELIAARKKDCREIMMERISRCRNSREISVPEIFRH